MSETRCPECQCKLKDKDLKNDKCWKCGLTPIMERTEEEKKEQERTEEEKKEQERTEEEKKEQERLEEKEKKKQELENKTLSEKFGGLETFKMFLMAVGILSTGGYVMFLFEWKANNVPDSMIFPIILGSLLSLILMWYSILNISRIINFLFELDERISDKK